MNFLDLPNEILFKIVGYLDFLSLLKSSLICKRISCIANEVIEKRGAIKVENLFMFPTAKQHEINTFPFKRKYQKQISFSELDFYFEAEKVMELAEVFNESTVLEIKELKIVQEFGSLNDRDCVANIVRFISSLRSIQQLSIYIDFAILCEDLVTAVQKTLPGISVLIVDKSEVEPESLIVEYFHTPRTEESQKLKYQNFPRLKKALNNPCTFTAALNFLDTLELTALERLKLCSLYKFEKLTNNQSQHLCLKALIIFSNKFEIPMLGYDSLGVLCRDNRNFLQKLTIDIKGGDHILRILSFTEPLCLKKVSINMGSTGDFKMFTIKLLQQQSSTLESVSLKYFDIDDDLAEALGSVERLESLRLAYCGINLQTSKLTCRYLKKLDLTGSRLKFDTLDLILCDKYIQSSLEDLYLEKICLGFVFNPLDISHLTYNFENLRRLNILECPVNRFVTPKLTSLKTDYNLIQSEEIPTNLIKTVSTLTLGELRTVDDLEFLLGKFSKVTFLEIISRFELYQVVKLLKYCKVLRFGVINCKWTRNLQYEEDIERVLQEFEEFDIFRENSCVKISNRDRTIFIHNMNSTGLSHIYYSNFMHWLWN